MLAWIFPVKDWNGFFSKHFMKSEPNNLDGFVNDKLIKLPTNHVVNKTLKWLPILSILLFKPGKGKGAEFLHRLKLLGLSEMFVISVLEASAYLLPRKRPDPCMRNDSFPSGHTAHAFLGAAILHQRVSERSPVLALGGYGIAISMGVLRLFNKKHWLSDVVAGAVLGILSAKLASMLLKTKPSRFRQMIQEIKMIRSERTMNQTILTVGS